MHRVERSNSARVNDSNSKRHFINMAEKDNIFIVITDGAAYALGISPL